MAITTNLTVVQRGTAGIPNGNGSWAPTITLSSAPVQGNLLVAIVYSSATLSAATGWTQDTAFVSGTYHVASFYKYAGVSESATQSPTTTTVALASLVMWEVSGASGVWANDHVASGGAVTGGTAATSDSFSLTTTIGTELILGGWVGSAPSGSVSSQSGTLSTLLVTTQSYALGGTTPLYVFAMAGELGVIPIGQVVTDNWAYTAAVYQNKIYIQLTSDYLPTGTQGVAKINAYAEFGVTEANQVTSKINAYAEVGPGQGNQVVSKITGYTMLGPATSTPGWISVME